MKRLALALVLALLLLPLSGCLGAGGQAATSPHEDPSLAREALDGFSLLRFYTDALGLIAASSYQDAQALLAELREASLPQELRYISDRYNDLCQELTDTLDRLDALLAETAGLLDQNRLDEAGQRLSQSVSLIDEARLVFDEIQKATDVLTESLGAAGGLVGGSLAAALVRLDEAFGRLEGLLDRLAELRQQLAAGLEQAEAQLKATGLELGLTPTSAFVGEGITFTGRLTSEGGGLAGREVALYLAGREYDVVTTADGSFVLTVNLPYNYVPVMTAQAFFIPSGVDVTVYAGTFSPSLQVSVLFYETGLVLAPPPSLHPGLPLMLNGQISSKGEVVARQLKIWLGGELLAETSISGSFAVEIIPPPAATDGAHALKLEVTSSGRYQGTSLSLDVEVSRFALNADVEIPVLIVLPGSLQVNGQAYYSDGFPDNAEVTLSFRGYTSTVATADFGQFSTDVKAPFEPFLFGPRELEVTITPEEPWLEPLKVVRRVLVINPLHLGLMAAAILSVGLFGYRRRRTAMAIATNTAALQSGWPPLVSSPPRLYDAGGVVGRVLAAYLQAQAAVAVRSGLVIKPQQTLSEYLAATPLPPSLKWPFAALIALAEAAMYSGRQPEELAALKAEELAAGIVKEVEFGVSL